MTLNAHLDIFEPVTPSIKITILSLTSSIDAIKRAQFSGPSYLHYSNVVYEDPSIYEPSFLTPQRSLASASCIPTNSECDTSLLSSSFTENYCDAMLSSRPEPLKKIWPSSAETVLTADLYTKLKKARINSIQLPPLPRSPNRKNSKTATSTSYYTMYKSKDCKRF
jgi:hypothetical protein